MNHLIDKHSLLPCWLWLGSVTGDGFPQYAVSHSKTVKVHTYLWEQKNGPKPTRILKRSCNNKSCVNPDHYTPLIPKYSPKLRTIKKGLFRYYAYGEANKNSKLTIKQVRSIRRSTQSTAKLAIKHGVSEVQINRIKSKKNWAHEISGTESYYDMNNQKLFHTRTIKGA